jgi:hypothetical protein
MKAQNILAYGIPAPPLSITKSSVFSCVAGKEARLQRRHLMFPLLAILTMTLSFPAAAQSYYIDWFKIAGGGGTSTNGQYIVSGTIGQHDAGSSMSGGNYSLTSGYWSLIAAVQSLGAPRLRIFLTGTNTAVIAWPAPSTGFALQQNSNLITTNWITVPNATNVVGGENQVIISPPVGKQFYRLQK